ncbi:hypothetical protein N752_00600 [Desulforamulus aquiferis]|nr:hypothetical protein [Desulforamulus aquiferis]RYD07114.1 hypothetical protein N752_00600 [Desulforamulus aquiferis]
MFPFLEVTPLLFQTLVAVILDPLFLLVVGIVALQYSRIGKVRESFLG